MKAIDMVGKVFGRLTVLAEAGKKGNRKVFECRCKCGAVMIVHGDSLRRGNTRSCGCYKQEVMKSVNKTHGKTYYPEYRTWMNIKNRCYNEKAINYSNYGGRGIMMWTDWLKSFEAFYRDMGPKPSSKHSIDRIDPNDHYTPDNCRWATAKEQQRNRRNNRLVEYDGKKMTLAELAETTGVHYPLLQDRLAAGWPVKEAIETPVRDQYMYNGVSVPLTELAKKAGVKYPTLLGRLNLGWSIKDALETPIFVAKEYEYLGRRLTVREWARERNISQRLLHSRLKRGLSIKEAIETPTLRK